jgi:hypothetical protein
MTEYGVEFGRFWAESAELAGKWRFPARFFAVLVLFFAVYEKFQ